MIPAQPVRVLVGYKFHRESGPHFIVDSYDGQRTTREQYPIWKKTVMIKPLPFRQCIGQYNILTQESIPCPDRNRIPIKTSQQNCQRCFETVGFNPSFFKVPPSHLSPIQQEYNLRPHYVYLADFGVEAMKVGTAYQGRYIARWQDQGARLTTIVKECKTAYEAREWEVKISQAFSLPEGIPLVKKKALLNIPYDYAQRAQELTQLAQKVTSHFNLDPTVIKVHNLHESYFQEPIPGPLKDVDFENKELTIKVIGLMGNILVFSYRDGNGMLPLSHLIGRVYLEIK